MIKVPEAIKELLERISDKTMLTTAEVAAILDCTPSNVCKLWNLGKLRGEKLGHRTLRIYRDSVLEHLSILAEEPVDEGPDAL